MATVQPSPINYNANRGATKYAIWEPITDTNEVGASVKIAMYPDKSVTMDGTWASATAILQGSSDDDDVPDSSATWHTLHDPQGNALSFTANDTAVVAENLRRIRPFTSGGTGTQSLRIVVSAL